METVLIVVAGHPVTWSQAVLALLALAIMFLLVLVAGHWRAAARQHDAEAADALRKRELDDKFAELARIQSEMTGRMQTLGEVFGSRQADLVRLLAERLDALQHRVGVGLQETSRRTTDDLGRLNERLAVIDAAQQQLNDLSGQVLGLKEVLANKQTRGAFGQGRMEAIIRDGLPPAAFRFQAELSNGRRPDCLIFLPGDDRPLAVDAKFPLEGFTAFREAKGEEARRAAMQRVRGDLGVHIKDVSDRYLIPGETQDIALLFVPAESLFADLQEHFEDVVERAQKCRILVVSPSLLSLAIQVMQAIVRDARMREQAHLIQAEVGKLLADIRRMRERTLKLDAHFRQAGDDVNQILTSADKILKRGERMEAMEFDAPSPPAAPPDGTARPLAAE